MSDHLVIANTKFRKRISHLVTLTSGGRETQIDFWMLRRPDRNIYLSGYKGYSLGPRRCTAPSARHGPEILSPKKATRRIDTQRIKWWKLKEQKDQALPAFLSYLTSSIECAVEEQ
ncbi:hypothetical protein Y032_0275g1057 [Ancylostoma ceylanicum]|uniref:Uncharacterized protein n=1 Tax=Ancylostoma ceylanicum TaxID=53326 RepID=A0A016S7S0_9BILA|nr:hypothetical protein Y032_0275g1057 [Ancylostoma ceylanicum]